MSRGGLYAWEEILHRAAVENVENPLDTRGQAEEAHKALAAEAVAGHTGPGPGMHSQGLWKWAQGKSQFAESKIDQGRFDMGSRNSVGAAGHRGQIGMLTEVPLGADTQHLPGVVYRIGPADRTAAPRVHGMDIPNHRALVGVVIGPGRELGRMLEAAPHTALIGAGAAPVAGTPRLSEAAGMFDKVRRETLEIAVAQARPGPVAAGHSQPSLVGAEAVVEKVQKKTPRHQQAVDLR